jgi:hypothetical protein
MKKKKHVNTHIDKLLQNFKFVNLFIYLYFIIVAMVPSAKNVDNMYAVFFC